MDIPEGQLFAVTDIETTGSGPQSGRITEVAVVLHDGKRTVREYQQLINPGVPVPPYITRITGITDDMLRDAPRFEEVSEELYEVLSGNIFVAHNVKFDYNFLKYEFLRAERLLDVPHFCTIRLSRKLIPSLKSYGLARLTDALDIKLDGHHRALNDARATAKILEKLYEKDPEKLYLAAQGLYANDGQLPPQIPEKNLLELPEGAAVVYFMSAEGEPLRIEPAASARDYALKRLGKKYKKKSLRELREKTTSLQAAPTGNLLTAQLLALEEQAILPPSRQISLRKKTLPTALMAKLPATFFLFLQGKGVKEKEVVAVKNTKVIAVGTVDEFAQISSAEELLSHLEPLNGHKHAFSFVLEAISKRRYLKIQPF